jgi:hypothetical protein
MDPSSSFLQKTAQSKHGTTLVFCPLVKSHFIEPVFYFYFSCSGVPETAVLIPPETIDSILRQALHSFNAAAVFVYNVYHCRNNALTVQVLIGLVVFNIISRLFSDVQILFIGMNFTLSVHP